MIPASEDEYPIITHFLWFLIGVIFVFLGAIAMFFFNDATGVWLIIIFFGIICGLIGLFQIKRY